LNISVDNIRRAATAIDPVFLSTPQFEADALGAALGARLVVKVETVNPIRSFKGRGTDWYMRQLQPLPRRVACASAGNFGQGLAYAARRFGVDCDVFAALNANPLKIERMRAFGAAVHLGGADFDEAKAAARAFATREEIPFVEDGREPAIAEGAGSMGVELSRWPEPLGLVAVPLGNGALLGGVGTWLRAASPETAVVGVCAAGAPSMERSWRAGHPVETTVVDTIADGIAVRVPVPEALETLRACVDDVVLVSEDALRAAMRLIVETCGLIVEPAGAAGIAALLEHRHLRSRGVVAVPLCGGNVTREQWREWGVV
jgi:threonine dehydratase